MQCYIFDIDGTLADCTHRLPHIIDKSPKDWDAFFAACLGDAPIRHMVRLAQHITTAGVPIVYVSGRSDQVREETAQWLAMHDLPSGPIFMRKRGDHRNDDVLKPELLAAVRDAGWKPIMAFDDRDRVVSALREAGLPVAQVAPGAF